MRGEDFNRDWYWRWSWDLRISGGLCDGGWLSGKRAIGGMECIVWSIGGAGVVAVVRDA